MRGTVAMVFKSGVRLQRRAGTCPPNWNVTYVRSILEQGIELLHGYLKSRVESFFCLLPPPFSLRLRQSFRKQIPFPTCCSPWTCGSCGIDFPWVLLHKGPVYLLVVWIESLSPTNECLPPYERITFISPEFRSRE
jgi:hypothetical protein